MTAKFTFSSVDRLSKADVAGCKYSAEIVEIGGVVSPGDQSDWKHHEEPYNIHGFTLSAWRLLGEPLVHQKLWVLRPISADEDWAGSFPECTVQRFKAILSVDAPRAILSGTSKLNEEDSELLAFAEELRGLTIVSTSRFGELARDRLGSHVGEVDWGGVPIGITLQTENDTHEEVRDALAVAEQLWDKQTEWQQMVVDYAVNKLLAEMNEDWLEEDELPLNAQQFAARMKLNTICIHANGHFEFWHSDGDMFGGHSILVEGTLNDGLTFVDTAG